MCVILVCPEKVRPSIETLALCEAANPHGGGIAWRRRGAVEWLKTNDRDELHRIALKAKGEIVIHFRIASIGAVCDELRHPFPVTHRAHLDERGQSNAVLFQNGTWLGYRDALEFARSEGHEIPDGPMSDARAAAFLCSIYGRRFLKKCGHSRWVYFSNSDLALFGQWHKRGGIYFSNLYWNPAGTEPSCAPQNVSKTNPDAKSAGQKPVHQSDLWDLSGTADYWNHLTRALPKPRRP
jgi:hypothetical protein